GYHSLGLKSDGSIVAWGANISGQCNVPAPNSGFTAVAAGYVHSLGLKSDGSIVAWGDNGSGQCNVPSPNSGFIAVAGGGYHSLGLKSDGSIVAWGYNGNGQCNVPSPNSGFIAIAAGALHSLALKSDGSVVAWGGQRNVPSPNSGFTAIAGGDLHSLGILRYHFTSPGALKQSSPAGTVFLESGVVTATAAQMGGFLYVEHQDRFSGLRVNTGDSRDLGARISVEGVLATAANGELEIAQATTGLLPSGDPLTPVALSNGVLGGGPFGLQDGITGASGLNNIGLLVITWGHVTEIESVTPPALPTWFKIDDGSGVSVKCLVPSTVTIDPGWQYVAVTGISSCEKIGADLHRLLRVRSQSDITPL
ncbi:MAG: hypothetical protein Q7T82_13825, partial [Armatimonadota bacterium]|nr:hypothetical protein [Armatimonadota bacterium]